MSDFIPKPGVKVGGLSRKSPKSSRRSAKKAEQGKTGAKPVPGASAASFKAKDSFANTKEDLLPAQGHLASSPVHRSIGPSLRRLHRCVRSGPLRMSAGASDSYGVPKLDISCPPNSPPRKPHHHRRHRQHGSRRRETVTVRGWLYNLRSSGKLLFPAFRDGTGTIQGIVPKAAVPEEVRETLKNLTLESSVVVSGKVSQHPKDPSIFELQVEGVSVTCSASRTTPAYPIQLKENGPDFLAEHRHLWLRTPRQSAILRVTAPPSCARQPSTSTPTASSAPTRTAILTPNACEGTSELFEMDYFGDGKAFLTQSGQLYVEATALALGKVYSFGPTFRAEKSKTRQPPHRVPG